MIVAGQVLRSDGLPRAYILARVMAAGATWQRVWFRIDTGADTTCLSAAAIPKLGLHPETLPIASDLGGVGSDGLPCYPFETDLLVGDQPNSRRFHGPIAVFCNPQDLEEPVLGMDVLQTLTLVLDVRGDRVLLTDQSVNIAPPAA